MTNNDIEELRGDPYRDTLNWLAPLLALGLAALELYFGFATPVADNALATHSIGVGVILIALVAIFFTEYWRPVLYIVLAIVGSYVGVVWLLRGVIFAPLRFLSGVTAIALFGLSTFLFYREELYYETM